MSENERELRDRIKGLSDEELVEMVTRDSRDYRPAAIDYAKSELRSRRIDFSEPDNSEAAPANFDPFPATSPPGRSETKCEICGGALRSGILVAEKELTIVFSDNKEERFLKVNACVQCGEVSLVVDFDTKVGS